MEIVITLYSRFITCKCVLLCCKLKKRLLLHLFGLLDQTGSDVMVLELGRVQNKTFMSFKVVRIYV